MATQTTTIETKEVAPSPNLNAAAPHFGCPFPSIEHMKDTFSREISEDNVAWYIEEKVSGGWRCQCVFGVPCHLTPTLIHIIVVII